ncbi:XRE family transcriptional regulator [Streptomyces sp. T1317-0309]|nr:XRE family transcriptional regulator [Streptomyces sp. T1317-0309]
MADGVAELAPAYRDLVSELRQLKDHSRLSLTELGRTTAISKSSWERYLNAKQFPPRHAVQALCRAAQISEEAVLPRWELADEAWNDAGIPRPHPDPPRTRPPLTVTQAPTTGPRSTRNFMHRTLLAASALITTRPWATTAGVSSCVRRCSHPPLSSTLL